MTPKQRNALRLALWLADWMMDTTDCTCTEDECEPGTSEHCPGCQAARAHTALIEAFELKTVAIVNQRVQTLRSGNYEVLIDKQFDTTDQLIDWIQRHGLPWLIAGQTRELEPTE